MPVEEDPHHGAENNVFYFVNKYTNLFTEWSHGWGVDLREGVVWRTGIDSFASEYSFFIRFELTKRRTSCNRSTGPGPRKALLWPASTLPIARPVRSRSGAGAETFAFAQT